MSTATHSALPRLRLTSLDEYEKIVHLESRNTLGSMPRGDWRNLWVKNPLWARLGKDWPIGWALDDADGRLVGSLVNIPSLYKYQGRDLICANGRGWVVAPEYRGFALALMDEYFNQPGADLFVNTTVGPNAAPMIGALSDPILQGDFQTVAYRPIAYRGFAEKALRRKNVPAAGLLAYPVAAALRLKDAVALNSFPKAPASVVIEEADRFDRRFDAFWEELLRQNPDKLLGERSARALAWHFSGPMRMGHLWILTASRNGLLIAYCILKRQDQGQLMRRMRLIDYQSLESQDDLLPGLLRGALRKCIAEDYHVLEHLGCGLPKMRSFERFAPYRRKLPCWPFYYRAADPTLASQLTRPEAWDPSAYDGDASYD
jgi:hypothetical protein